MKKALIMVDLQKDFCPGGSLAVAEGDAVIPVANRLQPHFEVVVATKDWHPKGHVSFASTHSEPSAEQWPDHCIEGSKGAEFHALLETANIDKIIYKGQDLNLDSYSAFFDNKQQCSTGLAEYLREQDVQELTIMGLATDYCVKYSCLDAVRLGFKVKLVVEGCRGVEVKPGDSHRALEEMRACGVGLIYAKGGLR